MEKARYWMWKSHFDASWEEEAFARDASQPYGAFIWPPRSYSCSFCRREFRTAQALGGHMNVHRRDRARLKLQLPSTTPPDHDKSMASDEDPDEYQIPTAPPKVSVASIDQKNRAEQTRRPLVSHCVDDQDQHDHEGNFSYFPQSRSNFVPIRVFSISDCERGEENPMKRRRSEVHDEGNSNKYDPSSMSLNLVMGPDHKEQTVGCKRIRSEEAPLPFFLRAGSTTTLALESTAEDLDLELRLGDPTKVK